MTSVKGAVNEATQTRVVEWIALGFGGDADQTGALATLAM